MIIVGWVIGLWWVYGGRIEDRERGGLGDWEVGWVIGGRVDDREQGGLGDWGVGWVIGGSAG